MQSLLRIACRLGVVLIVLGLGSSDVQAKPRVDWERGLLIASAAAPSDLRAPTTELARVKAERIATKRCEVLLRQAAAALPMASGKTAARVLGDELKSAKFSLIPLKTDHGSDGSVVVTMALPIDRLRTLHFGPSSPAAADATQAQAIFVDARGLKLVPGVGLGIEVQGEAYHGPVVFFNDEAAATAATTAGSGMQKAAPLKATSVKRGIVTIENADTLEIAGVPLVVVLYSETL